MSVEVVVLFTAVHVFNRFKSKFFVFTTKLHFVSDSLFEVASTLYMPGTRSPSRRSHCLYLLIQACQVPDQYTLLDNCMFNLKTPLFQLKLTCFFLDLPPNGQCSVNLTCSKHASAYRHTVGFGTAGSLWPASTVTMTWLAADNGRLHAERRNALFFLKYLGSWGRIFF